MNESVQKITHEVPELNTKGGTSDARYFAKYGVKVVELAFVMIEFTLLMKG